MKQLNNLLSAKSKRLFLLSFLLALLPSAVSAQCPDDNHPHMIDLGLSSGIKIACCNYATGSPEKLGDSFTWDEANSLNMGSYRLLTEREISEIVRRCSHEETTYKGVEGYNITGSNGKTIFLPAGDYWSCTQNPQNEENAYYMYVLDAVVQWANCPKSEKKYVRPVVALSPSSSNPEPYAVLSNDGQTVTFYYDGNKATRSGVDINNVNISWNSSSPYGTATTAVFDVSFADYRPVSTAYWFMSCSSLTTINGIENLNTANVTNMCCMFAGCSGLTCLDLSGFNTSNVTNMSSMFDSCNRLASLDVSGFDTSKVTDSSQMFWNCSALTNLDVSGFNTSNMKYMYSMFLGCSSLTTLDLSGFNTSNVTEMFQMFQDCSSLTSIDLSGFDTSKVTDMIQMFLGCSGLASLDLSTFDTSNVKFMNLMFYGCSGLTSLDLSGFNTSNVTEMHAMFAGCSGLTTIYADETKWNTEKISDNGSEMFNGSTSLVGGKGTVYDENHTDVEYARIDKPGQLGYFTQKGGSSGIAIDAKNFPDENFRNWVLAQDYGQDGVLTEEEIAGVTEIIVFGKDIADLKGIEYFTAMTELKCGANQLTSLDVSQNTALTTILCNWNQLTTLDVSKNTALTDLDCSTNQLTSLDVSQNTALTWLDCSWNQISGAAMDALIAGLPRTEGTFRAFGTFVAEGVSEQNVVTKAQVAAAKEKGWTTYCCVPSEPSERWIKYEGSDPEISPVEQGETIDIGTDIEAGTNLDGNVVGDVFYSISSGDGSYDPAEGCIVVTKPTDDSAIDGKDIFGEDFKAGYTGVVFKVAPGKGSVKVEAQTEGNMVLKVKIGDNDPIEMELEGRLKVSFPYNVSEETFVYIYGGMSAAGAKGMRKTAGTGALKIYGIEVTSGTDGIEDIKDERLKMKDSPVYNLSGQRVISSPSGRPGEVPTKGVYIINGKKVVVK